MSGKSKKNPRPRKVRCTKCKEVQRAPVDIADAGGSMACDACGTTLRLPPRKKDGLESTCEAQAVRPRSGRAAALIGQQLGSCRIEEIVGRGGMGTVYKAQHMRLDNTVAIKVLAAEHAENQELVDRFVREARTAARVTHPNLVGIHDVDSLDDTHYIVMEFVQGNPLDELIQQRGPLAGEEAAGYGRQVARGLAAAHKAGIIHRDIKPGNLMLTPERQIKITDFGLARAENENDITQVGQIMGTPLYMSPEQCHGKSLTALSDIYSLGLTLYFMVTGIQPMDADSTASTLLNQIQKVPPTPREVDPSLGIQLSNLIMKMIAKHPEDRPQGATLLAEQFENMTHDLPQLPTAVEYSLETLNLDESEVVPPPDPGAQESGGHKLRKSSGRKRSSRELPAKRETSKSQRRPSERRPQSARRATNSREKRLALSPLVIGTPIVLTIIGSALLMLYLNRDAPEPTPAQQQIVLGQAEQPEKAQAPIKPPSNPWDIHWQVYQAEMRRGNKQAASEQLERYLGYRPTNWKMRRTLAELAIELKNGDLALRQLRSLIKNGKDPAWCREQLPFQLLVAGRWAEAATALEALLLRDPTDSVRIALARAYMGQRKGVEAARQLLALTPAERVPARDLLPDLRELILSKYAETYKKFKTPREPILTELYRLDPTYYFYRLPVAIKLMGARNYPRAIEQFSQFLNLPISGKKRQMEANGHIGRCESLLRANRPRDSLADSRWLIHQLEARGFSYLWQRMRAQIMLKQGERLRRTVTLIQWYSSGPLRNMAQLKQQLEAFTGSDRLASTEEVARSYAFGFEVTELTAIEELQRGDFILTLDGKPLRGTRRLMTARRDFLARKRETLDFVRWRKGTVETLKLTYKRFTLMGRIRVKIVESD